MSTQETPEYPIDLSESIAWIQIGFTMLNLTWAGDRMQGWLKKATETYLAKCQREGRKPETLPPYRCINDMPCEMVVALGNAMQKAIARLQNPPSEQ